MGSICLLRKRRASDCPLTDHRRFHRDQSCTAATACLRLAGVAVELFRGNAVCGSGFLRAAWTMGESQRHMVLFGGCPP